MSARFEYGGGESWYPESEHFNWREIWLEQLEDDEIERRPLFFIIDEDNYCQQINEQNTMVFNNQADDDFDAVAIIDERDGKPWWWFRGLHDYFDDLLHQVGGYATVVYNDCPQDQVERNYFRVRDELGEILSQVIEIEEVDPIEDECRRAHEMFDSEARFYLKEWSD